MAEDVKGQIADLERVKRYWHSENGETNPFPHDELLAELRGKVKPRKKGKD